jgi:capsular polysaccharide biosynthesis protein
MQVGRAQGVTSRPFASQDRSEQMAQSASDKKINTRAVSMDVLSLLRLLAKHWRVTAPAALLTLVGLVAVFKVSAPTYNATGSILLLNPREAPDLEDPSAEAAPEVGQNAFTRYGDIAIVTDILTRIMNSDSKRDQLAQHGVAGYSIVTSQFQRDPVFEITGQGPDAASAMRSTELVLEEAGTVLSQVQVDQGADPDYLISSAPLEAPSTATAMYGSTMRAGIAVVAVGSLGTLGLAVLAEILGQRREASRAASRQGRVDADADDRVDPDVDDEVEEAAGSNGSARGRVDSGAQHPVDSRVDDGVVEAEGSNGSAVRHGADSGVDGGVVEAEGSNGSAVRHGADSGVDGGVVRTAASNGSAVRDRAAADDEAAEALMNGSADATAAPVVPGSARSRGTGRGLGKPAPNRSFNSARIVADGAPETAGREGRNGSPAWGRAVAPLGRRPHRRPSQPEGADGPPTDDQRERSKPDR